MTYAPLKRSKDSASPKPTSRARRPSGPRPNASELAEAERRLRGGSSVHPGLLALRGFNPITGFTNGPPERVTRQSATPRNLAPSVRRSPVIQAKLEIGSVNDPLESEADRIAERVVNQVAVTDSLQRTCDSCSTEDDGTSGQRVTRVDDNTTVPSGFFPPSDFAEQLQHAQISGGRSLAPGLRTLMERGFSVDFSKVRVHDDEVAARLSQQIGARAFTAGRDVFFNHGEFRPGSRAGHRIIAHELAHVVQQTRTPDTMIRRLSSSGEENRGATAGKAPVSRRERRALVRWLGRITHTMLTRWTKRAKKGSFVARRNYRLAQAQRVLDNPENLETRADLSLTSFRDFVDAIMVPQKGTSSREEVKSPASSIKTPETTDEEDGTDSTEYPEYDEEDLRPITESTDGPMSGIRFKVKIETTDPHDDPSIALGGGTLTRQGVQKDRSLNEVKDVYSNTVSAGINVRADFNIASLPPRAEDWWIGFAGTVFRSEASGRYTNDVGQGCYRMSSQPTVDRFDSMDKSYRPFVYEDGPESSEAATRRLTKSGTVEMVDSPSVKLNSYQQYWYGNERKYKHLLLFGGTGFVDLGGWMVIYNIRTRKIYYLYHINWQSKHTATYRTPAANPIYHSKSEGTVTGAATIVDEGPGKGSREPVHNGPIANKVMNNLPDMEKC
ncbi:MAG TPA: DUF4157 domain-containing protein [Nannocystis exedens]|nr:DUF4157 domain-containing protein [Nannocystis exedens]